jgi:hypothetical protein
MFCPARSDFPDALFTLTTTPCAAPHSSSKVRLRGCRIRVSRNGGVKMGTILIIVLLVLLLGGGGGYYGYSTYGGTGLGGVLGLLVLVLIVLWLFGGINLGRY